MPPSVRRTAAVGPVMPGWGSWDWVGTALTEGLAGPFVVRTFAPWELPDADVVVVVKHVPPANWIEQASQRGAVVYCPIDAYGGPDEIEADASWLARCARVVVHCRRLEPHFAPFVRTAYLDHPLKYTAPLRRKFRPDGPLLWVGVRSNLPPLVAWVNAHPLPAPLDVLTNPERPGTVPSASELGFRSDGEVRVHEWTPARHREMIELARAAVEIKGEDFRSRHKPPAKALDYIASGLPVALNPGSSPAEHLTWLGLAPPSPLDVDRWLSESYWRETVRLARRLVRDLAPARVSARAHKLLEEALDNACSRTVPVVLTSPLAATPASDTSKPAPIEPADRVHRSAQAMVERGEIDRARALLLSLDAESTEQRLRALVRNDLAALAAVDGDRDGARAGLASALVLDPDCGPARANWAALGFPPPVPFAGRPVRVAVLSLLFNWPSTGGGTVHTTELARFLAAAGYEVRHFYARFDPWGVGRVTGTTPYPAEELAFGPAEWTVATIQDRFRRAVDRFDPDHVIVSDSWNFKPLLADAFRGRSVFLRLQALECLCPLNNLRLLPTSNGARQCPRHQLATPDVCSRCVLQLGHLSGSLHQAERALSGVGTPGYREAFIRAFEDATAVLVVNPLAAAMVEPYARNVRVVTAGMDPARFPWPPPAEKLPMANVGRLRLLFAGLTAEWIKGYAVLQKACDRLWRRRQDFELVATDDPPAGAPVPYAQYVGWQSQSDLPRYLYSADVVVAPAVAQEALGRTAVEAMAAGRPVVASRIGGLPFTVIDEATGLLAEPGEPDDLARQLERLLDDAELRRRLGEAGRRRFEEHYSWEVIVRRHYLPLLGGPNVALSPTPPDKR